MIPVAERPEPASFDARVRQPGARYLASQQAPVTARRPYWRRALPDLCDAYDDTCAYLGIRVRRSTAFLTVDHFTPRHVAPMEAYEWSNFRLASPPVNTYKTDQSVPVDPFSVEAGEFELNLVSGEVEVGNTKRARDVRETIRSLKLNNGRFVTDRRQYLDDYLDHRITRDHLARWFPFGEAELTRQGH